MAHPYSSFQTLANHAEAILHTHFRQPETGLLYMYIDAHEPGRVNMPTAQQVAACIPNSNGFATPIENSNYASSQHLHTLLARYQVTRRPEHAAEVREIYRGLIGLWRASASPTFVPRGVLADGKTHYPDVSIDHMSYWTMGMWNYYRSEHSSADERDEIRRALVALAVGMEKNGWKLCREDGRLTFWCDLLDPKIPRSRLVLLMMLGCVYDVTGDLHWRRNYEYFKNNHAILELDRISGEETWISNQSAWLLETLLKIDDDPAMAYRYRALLVNIAGTAVQQIERYREFDAPRAWRDFRFRGETHRNVLFGAIGLALCPDAAIIHRHLDLVKQAFEHFDYRRDGKIVDLVDAMPRFYWLLASRGLLPFEPALDVPGDPTIHGIPADVLYPLNFGHWFDSRLREYEGNAPDENIPESQFFFTGS